MHRRVAALLIAICAAAVASAQPAGNDPRTPEERLSLFMQARRAVQERHRAQRQAITADTGRNEEQRRTALAVDQRNEQIELQDLPRVRTNHLPEFIYYALPPETLSDSFKEFLRTADKTRVDQQLGSPTKAAKTGVATLFGFALESGAVTQTIDQNVATLHANADGLLRFLSNQDLFPVCDAAHPDCDPGGSLKNVELSASFNVSDAEAQNLSGMTPAGNAVNFATLVTQHQFSSASVRYVVDKYNHRDLRSKAYLRKWLDWLAANKGQMVSAANDLLASTQPVVDALAAPDAVGAAAIPACAEELKLYNRWLCESNDRLAAAADAQWTAALSERLDVLLREMRAADPLFDRKLADAGKAFLRYMALRRSLAATVITDPALTVDYTYSEPQLQPRLHTVRVSWAYSPQGTAGAPNTGTITVNGGLDYYHEAQPTGVGQTTSHWKDAQFALQFDRPLGPADSAATLSAAFYWQYQMNANTFIVPPGATVLPGTNIALPPAGAPVLSEKGSIYVAQAMLTLRLAGSGLKVPIGISWANRTELLPGNRVIGHIGFTFDSSPLLLTSGQP